MKNSINKIIFALICTFLTSQTTYAQEGCDCILKYDADKALSTDEKVEELKYDYWVTMTPAGVQNKKDECGNRCILKAGTKIVKKSGKTVRIWACNNVPTSFEKIGSSETASTGTQSQTQSQTQAAPAPQVIYLKAPEKECVDCDDVASYLSNKKKDQEIERANDAADNANKIAYAESLSKIQSQSKKDDALLAMAMQNSGGSGGSNCGGCGGGNGGGSGAMMVTNGDGGGNSGNGVAVADLVIDGAHLVYDVAADIFGTNGRFRQRGFIQNTNTTTTNTNNGNNGTNNGGWNDFGN